MELPKTVKAKIAKEILWRVEMRTPLEGADRSFIAELLANHPRADEKRGAGVDYLYVDTNPGPGRSRGFFVKRIDGTVIDFSYKQCLGVTIETRVKQVMRLEVADQIDRYRRRHGAQPADDVHHVDPTFDELARTWLAQHGGASDRLLYHGPGVARLIPELSAQWRSFHAESARLVIVPRDLHKAFRRP